MGPIFNIFFLMNSAQIVMNSALSPKSYCVWIKKKKGENANNRETQLNVDPNTHLVENFNQWHVQIFYQTHSWQIHMNFPTRID